MPINKGDRVGHFDGFVGTALTAETNGSIQVRHDSGVVSTWAAGDTTVISRPSPSPATSTPVTPDRPNPTPAAPRKAAAKRPASKKVAKKPTRKRGTTKKSTSKKRTTKVRKKK
jgi:hypothetical protein